MYCVTCGHRRPRKEEVNGDRIKTVRTKMTWSRKTGKSIRRKGSRTGRDIHAAKRGTFRFLGKVAQFGLLLVVLRVAGVLAAALHEGALVSIRVGVLGVRVEQLLADLAGSDGGGVLAVENVDWRGRISSKDQFCCPRFSRRPRRDRENDSPCSSERPLVSGMTKYTKRNAITHAPPHCADEARGLRLDGGRMKMRFDAR